jgi:hypothetical protein
VLLPDDADGAATLRAAAALRGSGIAVAIGDVAEGAGQDIRRARVIDDAHVEYEGVVRTVDAVAAMLRPGAPR